MKLATIFKSTHSKRVKHLVHNKARREIDAYLKYAYAIEYTELESAGILDMYIDDAEIVYNDALQMLKDTNHNANAYFDEEDKTASYINLALSLVFQDISKKLITYDYQ